MEKEDVIIILSCVIAVLMVIAMACIYDAGQGKTCLKLIDKTMGEVKHDTRL